MRINKLWKLTTIILIFVVLFLLTFNRTQLNILKKDNFRLNNQVSDLNKKNEKLSDNISDLDESAKKSKVVATGSKKDNNLNTKFNEVAYKFVKLYPEFSIKSVEQKKKNLQDVAVNSIADAIVPDDLITSSKEFSSSNYKNKGKGEAYSTDPSFVSSYKSSVIYSYIVNAAVVKYFAEVNYSTKSSTGNTENTVYLMFDVSSKNGKIQVTNYEIKYLK